MSNNSNLHTSKRNKNDEYYTYYEDVVKGLEPYKEYLKGKRVLCPCDTDESNFVKYLKELGCDVIAYHKENGSEWFKPDNYDVCVTNPPFSKIKDFYNTYKDKPLIFICTFNHLTYVGMFEDFIEGRLNIGQSNQNMYFNAQGEHKSVSLCLFVSNLDIVEKNPHLELCKEIKGVYEGEMWTSMLICLLYSKMEAVAHRYGYDFVSTRDKSVLYIQVVCA